MSEARSENRLRVISLSAIAALVIADQLIKELVLRYIRPIGGTDDFLGIVRLCYVENTGASFGLFKDKTTMISIITALMMLLAVIYLIFKKNIHPFLRACLVLVISGGMGNLADRITRGYVIDYIDPVFVRFAVFNFADCCITLGAIAMAVYIFVIEYKNDKNKKEMQKNNNAGESD